MEISEIRKNVFADDMMMATVQCECTYQYVHLILRGDRNPETELAQAILTELERLATINIIANGEKNRRLVEAGRILFGRPLAHKSSSPKTHAA